MSLEFEAEDLRQAADGMQSDALGRLHGAFVAALMRHGVDIVAKGQGGAPALIGDIEVYREGNDDLFLLEPESRAPTRS